MPSKTTTAQELKNQIIELQENMRKMQIGFEEKDKKREREVEKLKETIQLQKKAQQRSFRIPKVIEEGLENIRLSPENQEKFGMMNSNGKAMPVPGNIIMEQREHESFPRNMLFCMMRMNKWKDKRTGKMRSSFTAWIPEQNLTLFDNPGNPGNFDGQEWNLQVRNKEARELQEKERNTSENNDLSDSIKKLIEEKAKQDKG